MRKIFLYSPFQDKGYSLHIFYAHGYNDMRLKLLGFAKFLDEKHGTRLFFQGDSLRDGWLMIEFWTDNDAAILDFCLEFAAGFCAELELTDWGKITLDEIMAARL